MALALPQSAGARVRARRVREDEPPDARLQKHIRSAGPVRRVLAALCEEFVRRKAWEPLGFARLGDYGRERLGRSAHTLRDLGRVSRKLGPLPLLERTLVTGVLSWTKVRLLARVATPEDERAWIAYARTVTASALSREVRAVETGSLEGGGGLPETDEDGSPVEQREWVVVRCAPEVNARWWSVRQRARLVAGETVPIWQAMEMVAAEVASALPLEAETADEADRQRRRPQSEPARDPATSRLRAVPADELPPLSLPPELSKLVRDLRTVSPKLLDARLRRVVALEQRLEARLSPLLLGILTERLYRHPDYGGYPSFERFARERLGLSPRKSWMLVRLERACLRCPALRDAYREGRISWVQAHALVPVLMADGAAKQAAPWVTWAQRVTLRRLEDDVARALQLRDCDPDRFEETGGLPQQDLHREEKVGLQIGATPSEPGGHPPRAETSQCMWLGPRDVARLFRATLRTVRRRLERVTERLPTEGEALGAMLEHALESWQAEIGREHRVYARDDWRCAIPGCSSYRNLHQHHVAFRSRGGGDEDANLVTLCAFHHLRGVHAGVIRISGRAPDALRFEMPLGVYRSGDVLVSKLT